MTLPRQHSSILMQTARICLLEFQRYSKTKRTATHHQSSLTLLQQKGSPPNSTCQQMPPEPHGTEHFNILFRLRVNTRHSRVQHIFESTDTCKYLNAFTQTSTISLNTQNIVQLISRLNFLIQYIYTIMKRVAAQQDTSSLHAKYWWPSLMCSIHSNISRTRDTIQVFHLKFTYQLSYDLMKHNLNIA